jgi:hypothetical protein
VIDHPAFDPDPVFVNIDLDDKPVRAAASSALSNVVYTASRAKACAILKAKFSLNGIETPVLPNAILAAVNLFSETQGSLAGRREDGSIKMNILIMGAQY